MTSRQKDAYAEYRFMQKLLAEAIACGRKYDTAVHGHRLGTQRRHILRYWPDMLKELEET